MKTTTIFFVQNSPALAGSQKSLLRLMKALETPWIPVLICGSKGWLTEETCNAGISVLVHSFPSSRSLKARLFGNRLFGKRVAQKCQAYTSTECLVHGNDHIHGLSAWYIAKALNVPSIITLRTSSMSRRDFFKYRCNRHNISVAVGKALYENIRTWIPESRICLIENGVDDTEICLNPNIVDTVPESIIVPGSSKLGKGWRDLVDALIMIENQGRGRNIEFILLGNDYGKEVNQKVGRDRLKKFKIRHIALTTDFKEEISRYQFAVHPSRSESFGMALLELLAAGIPVLTSRTGVAAEVIADSRFLFEPQNSTELAEKLDALMNDFWGAEQVVHHAQKVILDRYCISGTAAHYMKLYDELTSV